MDIAKALDPIRPAVKLIGVASLAIALAKAAGIVVPLKLGITEFALLAIACFLL